MDALLRTPLVECFLHGEVSRDLRLVAACGVMADGVRDQLTLLMLLQGDEDPEVAAVASTTIQRLPRPALAEVLARSDIPDELRRHYAPLVPGGPLAAPAATDDALVVDAESPALDPEAVSVEEGEASTAERRPLSSLSVVERMKLAMRGTREQRVVLIRDPNRLVAAAVLGSPKLTETEVEAFARMGNVSEDVLRVIGNNRHWTRSYAVTASLVKNPKTPMALAMPLVSRLNERDLKGLSTDRNVQEGIRVAARKLLLTNESRRR